MSSIIDHGRSEGNVRSADKDEAEETPNKQICKKYPPFFDNSETLNDENYKEQKLIFDITLDIVCQQKNQLSKEEIETLDWK